MQIAPSPPLHLSTKDVFNEYRFSETQAMSISSAMGNEWLLYCDIYTLFYYWSRLAPVEPILATICNSKDECEKVREEFWIMNRYVKQGSSLPARHIQSLLYNKDFARLNKHYTYTHMCTMCRLQL